VQRDGHWQVESPARVVTRAAIADTVAPEIRKKVRAPVFVDCGAGLFGFSEGDTLTCQAPRKGAAQTHGHVVVTFKVDGGFDWKATGV
jgi:hypothetical protein